MTLSNILSQEEVDTLLAKDTESSPGQDNTQPLVTPYSFVEPNQSEINNYISFEMIDDVFCQLLSNELAHISSHPVLLEVEKREILTYQKYIKAQERPSIINYNTAAPLTGTIITVLNFDMVSQWIESIFGGDIQQPSDKSRGFGKLELRIAQILSDLINQCLSKAWTPIYNIQLKHVKTLTNPATATVLNEAENVIVTHYRVLQADLPTTFSTCFAVSTLAPIMQVLLGQQQTHSSNKEIDDWHKNLTQLTYDTPIEIIATIEKINIPLSQLINLKVMDVLPISTPVFADVYADNLQLFKAKCGKQHGNHAISIIEKYEES